MGWSVAGAAIGHELTQELGDFLILVNQGGLSPIRALLVNFASALPCIFPDNILWGPARAVQGRPGLARGV